MGRKSKTGITGPVGMTGVIGHVGPTGIPVSDTKGSGKMIWGSNEITKVVPMSAPGSMMFYLDYTYSDKSKPKTYTIHYTNVFGNNLVSNIESISLDLALTEIKDFAFIRYYFEDEC